MIEDVLIWKYVAEHQPLHKSQLEPGILDRDCAHRRANCTQSRNLDASRVTDVLMLRCADALDEQLETVSAQIAPGAFQVARDQFASWDSNIEELTFRLCGVVFLLRPSH
jgi:hypothetical protein